MDHAAVEQWVSRYGRVWSAPGAQLLAELFVPDASYLASPWAQPLEGLEAFEEWPFAPSQPDGH